MGMGQNLVPLVNLKIAGKWVFIPLKMVLIGIDPYPYYRKYVQYTSLYRHCPRDTLRPWLETKERQGEIAPVTPRSPNDAAGTPRGEMVRF